MNIWLITPVSREYHAAREVFGAKELPGRKGLYRCSALERGGCAVKIIMTGPGEKRVAGVLELFGSTPPDLVVDSGSCGSLNDSFGLGEIVRSSRVICETDGYVADESDTGQFLSETCGRRGVLLDVENPVETLSSRELLRDRWGADVCTMESSAVCRWACERSVPWLSFRVVTDCCNEETRSLFKQNIRPFSLVLYDLIRKELFSE